MKIFRSTDELRRVGPDRLKLTIGNFDGCHLGHQAVLAELLSSASDGGGLSVVVTFEPHPIAVLEPSRAPRLLSPGRERTDLLAACGIEAAAVLEFSIEVAALDVTSFLSGLGVGAGSHLVLGYDFHMGRNRSGDVAMLGALGSQIGFGLDVVPPVRRAGRPISSSRVREALEDGDVEEAGAMLGRPYRVGGRVVPGRGLGRELGGPTANLTPPEEKLLPADGVYVVTIPGMEDRPGLLYVGRRPTFGDGPLGVELHVYDLDEDLYGRELEADLRSRLRGDRRFDTREELSEQIRRDLEAGRGEARGL